uniref:G-protein coupled receptors family 1 profile domain-containing protein n=1 Tax=Anguilla anguilla TaxID=7936 RepID=A0A0E9WTL0_ANGAN
MIVACTLLVIHISRAYIYILYIWVCVVILNMCAVLYAAAPIEVVCSALPNCPQFICTYAKLLC